jgi:site-specific recombinase XerD
MEKTELNQRPINLLHFDDLLQTWLEAFIVDRKIQKLSKGTIRYYIEKLRLFDTYCREMTINRIRQLTPELIRSYLGYPQQKGHNPSGKQKPNRSSGKILYV